MPTTNTAPEDMRSIKHRCLSLSRELLQRAARRFGQPMPKADICFDLRGRNAGMVRFDQKLAPEIRYNLRLLIENQEAFLAQTVPHEVAHIVVNTLFGRQARPHGLEWQAVMRFFGATPSRCHSFDTSKTQTRRLRRYAYRCACRQHQLTSIRHRRAEAGQVYLCVNCREPLKPSE